MRRWIKRLFYSFLFLGLLGLGAVTAAYYHFSKDLPKLGQVEDYQPPLMAEVFDDEGNKIGEFWKEDRQLTPFEKIPEKLIQAFVASEDDRFFEHGGVDLSGVARAFFKNLLAGRIKQGASTITQQLVKSILLTPEKTYDRKIKEAILATRIEKNFTKDQILYLYLNQIYFGNRAYGVGAAAKNYFHKDLDQLNLAEIAILAGLPKSPNKYNPVKNPEAAETRIKYVLNQMVEEEYITTEEALAAQATSLQAYPALTYEEFNLKHAPYFVEEVRRELIKKYGSEALYTQGWKIHTTLNLSMYQAAEKAVQKGLEKFSQSDPGVVSALYAMEPSTGAVKAIVGGSDYAKSEFNRATQARLQAGSTIKPLIYAAALDKGYSPDTPILDGPFEYKTGKNSFWKPRTGGVKTHKPIAFRNALRFSRNVPSVKILLDIGTDFAAAYMRKMGLSTTINKVPAMALGANEVYLSEMVQAYTVFASGGRRPTPHLITKIVAPNGSIVEEFQPNPSPWIVQYGLSEVPSAEKTKPPQEWEAMDYQESLWDEAQAALQSDKLQLTDYEKKMLYGSYIPEGYVISPQTATTMVELLQGVVTGGTGRRAQALGRPAAGKTGTTNQATDVWFIGFTPNLVAGAWVGHDEEKKSLGRGIEGGNTGLPIWLDFMKAATQNYAQKDFKLPKGLDLSAYAPPPGQIKAFDPEMFKKLDKWGKKTDDPDFFVDDLGLP